MVPQMCSGKTATDKPKFDPTQPFTTATDTEAKNFDPDRYLEEKGKPWVAYQNRQSICLGGLAMYSGFLSECMYQGSPFPKDLTELGFQPETFVGTWPTNFKIAEICLVLLIGIFALRFWGEWIVTGKRPLKLP